MKTEIKPTLSKTLIEAVHYGEVIAFGEEGPAIVVNTLGPGYRNNKVSVVLLETGAERSIPFGTEVRRLKQTASAVFEPA